MPNPREPVPSGPAYRIGPLTRATFLERPNRFIVTCEASGLGLLRAYLPNPGRLRELFLPDAALFLLDHGPAAGRKTRYTVAAVERDGRPVFLHTHDNNRVARRLLECDAIPGLEQAEVAQAEVSAGRSRFDFLLNTPRGQTLLEVKSCTLYGNGVAMFPDAVTARGRRHVTELAQLTRPGRETAVLFLTHTPAVRWFMPDYHTDLEFARAMLASKDHVRFIAASLDWRWRSPMLELEPLAKPLEIPWARIASEARDQGSYLVILELRKATKVKTGELGVLPFRAGYYVYVGSAAKGLGARVARHLRRRKRKRWHIDYLRDAAAHAEALPVRASTRDEHALAAALEKLLEPGPAGFGASDSPRTTHLFHSPVHPLELARFHELLQRFRMRPPERRAGR